MWCPKNTIALFVEFFEDGIGGGCPCEGAAVLVVVLGEAANFCNEILDAFEGASTDCLLGDESDPSFDLIEPGRIRRRVVDVESGPRGQP